MDCALTLIRHQHSISRTCRLLWLARSHIVVLLRRDQNWQDARKNMGHIDKIKNDRLLIQQLQKALNRFPSFGYRRLTAVVNRQRLCEGRNKVNVKRVYRVPKQENLLLATNKALMPGHSRDHSGKIHVQRTNSRSAPMDLNSSA